MKANPGQIIEHFREIDLKSPADVIIQQIKELISSGVLRPGDRLPPERALAERFLSRSRPHPRGHQAIGVLWNPQDDSAERDHRGQPWRESA